MAEEKKPLVTIAIPIYNAEKYLRDAIQSCVNQTFQDWELLLMCDGSTDGSNLIAMEMARKDSRIRVVDDGENRGLVYRLNQSVNLAKGKYYARMDADDIMDIHRIQKQVEVMMANPKIDVLGSSVMLIDNENRIVGSSYSQSNESFNHPSVMGKTKWFRANPYDETALRAEDFDLWNRTRSYSCFENIRQPLMFYRIFGMPTTKKMLQTYRTGFKLCLRYKRYNRSWLWGSQIFITSCLKSAVLLFLAMMHKQDLVIRMRKYISVPMEYQLSKDDLENSITTNVF